MKKYLVTLYTKGTFGNKRLIFIAQQFNINWISGDVIFVDGEGLNVGLVNRSLIQSITEVEEQENEFN